jgi:hypothetical protein
MRPRWRPMEMGCHRVAELHRSDDLEESSAFYRRRLIIAKEMKDARGELETLADLARNAVLAGNPLDALPLLERRFMVAQQIGDRLSEAGAFSALGEAYSMEGQNDKAFEHYVRAASLYRALGDNKGAIIWRSDRRHGRVRGQRTAAAPGCRAPCSRPGRPSGRDLPAQKIDFALDSFNVTQSRQVATGRGLSALLVAGPLGSP